MLTQDINIIHHFDIDHNAPCIFPQILHHYCLQFLLGITVVPILGDPGAVSQVGRKDGTKVFK